MKAAGEDSLIGKEWLPTNGCVLLRGAAPSGKGRSFGQAPGSLADIHFCLTLVPITPEISVTVTTALGSITVTRYFTLGIWKRLTTK